MEIVLESVDCQAAIVTVAPEDPKITQATCTAGPKIVMPNTKGIVSLVQLWFSGEQHY